MPVTISPISHAATAWEGQSSAVNSSAALFQAACPKEWRRSQGLLQSSFEETDFTNVHIGASQNGNGFVDAAFQAYSYHHHLVIRPEDIWFAILTQLSFYINAHAEELRSFFVPHDGKKELEAVSEIRDFGMLAMQMTDLLAKNVNDPGLRDWVMPSFTTTTYHDKVVGAVLFMGAMQSYFEYFMSITCGLPSVTLLGEVADYREILRRLDLIDQLGDEATHFASMLRPIIQHMVLTFDEPDHADVASFWNRIVHKNEVGSGTDYLSGWLTAFCLWDEEGKAKHLGAENALFSGVQYPTVDIDRIPVGFAAVPVNVNDNGRIYGATMVAGSVGIVGSSSNASMTSQPGLLSQGMAVTGNATSANELDGATLDTVQALSGWWIYETEGAEVEAARKYEMMRLRAELRQIDAYRQTLRREERVAFSMDEEAQRDYWKAYERLRELEAF